MRRVYDDERLAGAYERGNEMPEASLRAWVDLIASYVPRPSPSLLEIGSGTGMFSAAMARWIEGSEVLAVDPSDAMLARTTRTPPCATGGERRRPCPPPTAPSTWRCCPA